MKPLAPKFKTRSGVEISIQASHFHHCNPRQDHGPYDTVELGFPTAKPPSYIMKFAKEPTIPLETVYGYVPLELVKKMLTYWGGLSEEESIRLYELFEKGT